MPQGGLAFAEQLLQLREGVELVEDIGGALALEHLPLGFLYLDDGKTRVSNDPLLSYAAPRTMLGAVVALDDAWHRRALAAVAASPAAPTAPTAPPRAGAALRARDSAPSYAAKVAAAKAAIDAGDSYEICLTTTFEGPETSGDVLAAYEALRDANPAPHASLLDFRAFAGAAVLSSSPERFLRVSPDGAVEAKPIKGTAPRSADAAARPS